MGGGETSMLKFLKKQPDESLAATKKRCYGVIAICIICILLATLIGSIIQTNFWAVKVTDLRKVTNSGTIKLTPVDEVDPAKRVEQSFTLSGKVNSGILYMPKKASTSNKLPAIIFRHGAYNNREMQLSFAIEMVRRGYVVLAIDNANHGHNTEAADSQQVGVINAAAYLINLGVVDPARIGVSGHSMGGMATNATLQNDSVLPGTQTIANFKAMRHMGLFSSGVSQAAGAPVPFSITYTASEQKFNAESDAAVAAIADKSIVVSATKDGSGNVTSYRVTFNKLGSNILGSAIVKGNADEFFYGGSTLKTEQYVLQNKDTVTAMNYTNYFVKKGGEFVKATKFAPYGKYYAYTKTGRTAQYLQSSPCFVYTRGYTPTASDDWDTINRAIYANGKVLAQPSSKRLISQERKGQALASPTVSIRAVYEEKEIHPMNHFSIPTTANVVDFFYDVYGVVGGSRYINPMNQTWWIKEGFAIIGLLGLFGLLIPVVELLLHTPLFASLKGEPEEEVPVLTTPRKVVSYWLGGILTTIFGAISFKNLIAYGKWYNATGLNQLLDDSTKGFIYANTGKIAAWGIMCGLFALVVTCLIWLVNRVINVYRYGDEFVAYDDHPLSAFKIRSWGNIFKTLGLALILVVLFYGIVNIIWSATKVQFQFWVFGTRVFDAIKIPSMLKYVPYFSVFYIISAGLSKNYRAKEMPEWATILINIFFNVAGFMIVVWYCNSYFINNGAMIHTGNNMHYIHAYPIVPCIAIATVLARRIYVRTGNAWLAGIVNGTLMTFIGCANTSFSGTVAWIYA